MPRCIPVALLAWLVTASPLRAQMEFEDPLSRFAITLPEGFELAKEQGDQLYQFKRGAVTVALLVEDGASDPVTAFRSAADAFTGRTVPPPPEGSVYQLVVNGNAARQARYPFENSSNGKHVTLHFFLGTVTLEGTGMSVAFMSMLNEKLLDFAPKVMESFHSIRMPGTDVVGASEPVPVSQALATEAAEAAEAAPDIPPSTFEHPLVTLDLGAGWTATPGEGYKIATLERKGFPAVRLIGAKKNDFGKSRDEILKSLVAGFQSVMPAARQTRPPREEATTSGDVVLIAEYEGAIIVEGREVPQWVLIAAFKDKKRGLGYMWMTPPDKRDQVLEDVLRTIRSTR